MSPDEEQLFAEALRLPAEVRASLAARLIESLDGPPDPGVEAAWKAEIARRLREIDAGTAKMVPWEEVRARLQETIDKLRR